MEQEQKPIQLPKEYLIEGVKQSVKDVIRMMNDARFKYGNSYNEKND